MSSHLVQHVAGANYLYSLHAASTLVQGTALKQWSLLNGPIQRQSPLLYRVYKQIERGQDNGIAG